MVCTGVKLDWDKVIGLAETLGTQRRVQQLFADQRELHLGMRAEAQGRRQGRVHAAADAVQVPGRAAEDRLPDRRPLAPPRHPRRCKLDFFTHAPAIFGVPYFARALVKVAARYGIGVHYQQQLVAVNGNAKTATFEFVGDNRKGEKENVPFDLLHVTPPQSPHDEIKTLAARQCRRLGRCQSGDVAACALCECLFARRCLLDAKFEDGGGRAQAGTGGRRRDL